MSADRVVQLGRVRDHLAAAAQGLADAGYPNEAETVQRLVSAVVSHQSNAKAKAQNRG